MTRHTVTEYIPRFFIVETSTVFLDIMWLLKEASLANSALYRVRGATSHMRCSSCPHHRRLARLAGFLFCS